MDLVRTMMRPAVKRWTLAIVATLLLGVGLVTVSTINAPTAQAGFFGICDADTSFPAPASPALRTNDSGYASSPVGHAVTIDGKGETFNVVPLEGAQTPAGQYRGTGLTWYPWAHTCMDAGPVANISIANLIFDLVAVVPSHILGVLLDIGFGSFIVDTLLDLASDVVNATNTNVFTQWAPLMIMFVLIFALFKVVRNRGREAFGDFAWMIVVIVGLGILSNPYGINIAKSVSKTTQDITMCVTFGMAGTGCEDTNENGSLNSSSAMIETLAATSWGAGVMGELSGKDAPETLTIPRRDETPKFNEPVTITLPLAAIPAKVPGKPSMAEVWRWTQTYTVSELRAMEADASLRCNMNPTESPRSNNIANKSWQTYYSASELCSLKWLVRAGIAAEVIQFHPQHFATLRGASPTTLNAAWTSVGVLPLAIAIGVMAAMVLFYQIEFVFLIAAAPVIGLLSLRTRRIARKWGETLLMTLIKRISVGVALGLILWATQATTGLLSSLPYSNPQFSALWQTGIILTVMIVAVLLLKKITALLAESAEVTDHGNAFGETGKKILHAGVGAAAGAMSAGSGLRVMGALKGAGRGGALGSSGVSRAFQQGDQAGINVMLGDARGDKEREAVNAVADKVIEGRREIALTRSNIEGIAHTRARETDVGRENAAAHAHVQEVYSELEAKREAITTSPTFLGTALSEILERVHNARAAVAAAEDELAAFENGGRAEFYESQVDGFESAGLSPHEARSRAAAAVEKQHQQLQAAVESAHGQAEHAWSKWTAISTTHPEQYRLWKARSEELELAEKSPNPEHHLARLGLEGENLDRFYDLRATLAEHAAAEAAVEASDMRFQKAVADARQEVYKEAEDQEREFEQMLAEARERHGKGVVDKALAARVNRGYE